MGGGAFDTHGGIKMHTKFWLENLTGRNHYEELRVDEKTLEWNFGK
jgi:hypothetical protein